VPQVELTGPAGRLEALWEEPPAPQPVRFAAIVCHPHPAFGGTMHNHATYRLARAIRSRGGATLRFNFRGVGLSAGAHDEGRGEPDDARAALRHVAGLRPDLPRIAAGFSFGAWMALEAGCPDADVRAILCGGLALRLRDAAVSAAVACRKRVAVVQAERDAFGTPDEVRAALAGSAGPRRVAALPGATHLCTEDLAGFEREVGLAVDWLLEDLA
jgi:alpha/beta superfamily hydrolase